MINETFEGVIAYDDNTVGKVFLHSLNIKEFARKLNVKVEYFDPAPHTTPFEPKGFDVLINIKGEISYQNSSLTINGDAIIFDGVVKLEQLLHPDTDIIVRFFDNLSKEQIINLLSNRP